MGSKFFPSYSLSPPPHRQPAADAEGRADRGRLHLYLASQLVPVGLLVFVVHTTWVHLSSDLTATAKGFATGTALALFMRTFYPPPGPWSSAVLPLSMRVFTIFALDLFFPTGLVLAGIAVRFRAARARRWDVESALALLSQVALFPVMVYTVTDIGRMLLLGVPWIAGLAWEAAMDGVKWVQLAGAEYGYDLEFGSTFGSGFGDAAAHLRWTGLVARLESVKDMVVAQWNTSLGRAGVRDLAEEFEMFYVAFPEAVAIEAAAAAAVVAEVLPVASAFEFEAVPNSAAEQLAVPTRLEL